MTVMALRYETRPGRFRPGNGGGSGSVRDARASQRANQMDDARTMKLRAIQERLEREEYEIDPGKVAEAIIVKLLATREAKK